MHCNLIKEKFLYLLIVVQLQNQCSRLCTFIFCPFTSIILILLKLNMSSHCIQGRGGEELSTELSVALQRCLLGGKSGAGLYSQQCMTSSTNLLCHVCFLICHFTLYPLIMHCFYGLLLFKLIMKWLNLSQGLELIYHL